MEHFAAQGVETHLLDNDSTDRTVEIAEGYLGQGLIGIESFPREVACQMGRPSCAGNDERASTP